MIIGYFCPPSFRFCFVFGRICRNTETENGTVFIICKNIIFERIPFYFDRASFRLLNFGSLQLLKEGLRGSREWTTAKKLEVGR